MVSRCSSILALTLTALLAVVPAFAANGDPAAENRKIAQLERQNAVLRESYALTRADLNTAKAQLREIRERLEALGGTALSQSEERLIETVAQLEATRAELETLKQSSLQLSAAIGTYASTALAEDPQARLALESAIRDLDLALGLRQAPVNELEGDLFNANILSIDEESGLIVINAGREAKVEVGMPMEISRGDQAIAHAIVTDVRKKVSGLLVQKRLESALVIQVGDSVSVKSSD